MQENMNSRLGNTRIRITATRQPCIDGTVSPVIPHFFRRPLPAACLGAWIGLLAGTATADTLLGMEVSQADASGNQLIPFINLSEYDNSNLFGLSNPQYAQKLIGTTQTSDLVSNQTIGLDFDYAISGQSFSGHASYARSSYQTFSEFNNNTRDLGLQWNWAIGRLLSGDVGASDATHLTNLIYVQNTINIYTLQNAFAHANVKLSPHWQIIGGATTGTIRNSSVSELVYNTDSTTASAGIKYVTDQGNSISLVSKQSNGNYPDVVQTSPLILSGYRQYDSGLEWSWLVSGRSRLLGSLYVTRMTPDSAASLVQGYSGATGHLTYAWAPTGKLKVNLNVYRNINEYEGITSNYVVTNGVSLMPVWNITEKLAMNLGARSESLTFPPGSSYLYLTNATTHYRINTASFGIDYQMFRHTDLTLSLDRGSRVTNIPGLSYTWNDATLSLTQKF